MATKKITKRNVDAAKPGAKDDYLWDEDLAGFGLKITPRGAKTYLYQYRTTGGKTARVTIGRHGSPWTPDMAREAALAHAVKVAKGIDPKAEQRGSVSRADSLAFDRYVEIFATEYLERYWVKFKSEGARLLRREAVPFFGSTPLPAITRRQIREFFDSLSNRPGIAKNTSTALRKLFRWAVEREDITHSPMADMAMPKGPGPADRFLADDELRIVWAASNRINHPYAALVRVLLLTGQRLNEVARMHRSEVESKTLVWRIPASRTKNKKVHLVPLPPTVWQEIGPAFDAGTEYLFTASGEKPIQNWSYWKKRLDERVNEVALEQGHNGLADWNLHDLRRTVATGLQRLDVRWEVIEAIANRLIQGVSGRYQKHDWLPEKRDALSLWAEHVKKVVA